MLKKKEILIPADTYEKHAVVYHDTDSYTERRQICRIFM